MERVAERLASDDPAERRAAVVLCAMRDVPGAREMILGAVRDPDPGVRQGAAWALGQRPKTEDTSKLLALLDDPSFEVRSTAGWSLVALGPAVLESVGSVWHDGSGTEAREMALLVLRRITDALGGLPAEGSDVGALSETARALIREVSPMGRWNQPTLVGAIRGIAHDMNNNLLTFRTCVPYFRELIAPTHTGILRALDSMELADRAMERHIRRLIQSLGPFIDGSSRDSRQAAQWVAGFLHDFNNAMLSARICVDWLRDESRADGPEAAQEIDAISHAIDTLEALTRELRMHAFGRNDRVGLHPTTTPLKAFAERIRRRLRTLVLARPIEATVTLDPSAPEDFTMDVMLCERIMDNLLTNAAKYTDRGRVEVVIAGVGEELRVTVSDTGRGIESGSLRGVFTPGGSDPETRVGEGYGVGLSVVVDLLDLLGGHLDVSSEVSVGTAFSVTLPSWTVGAHSGRVGSTVPARQDVIDRVVRLRSA